MCFRKIADRNMSMRGQIGHTAVVVKSFVGVLANKSPASALLSHEVVVLLRLRDHQKVSSDESDSKE